MPNTVDEVRDSFEGEEGTRTFAVSLKIAALLNEYCRDADDVEEVLEQVRDILKSRFAS